MVQLSHSYTTTGNIIALTIQTFLGKVMSLLFNILSRFVIAFLNYDTPIFIIGVALPRRHTEIIDSILYFPTLSHIIGEGNGTPLQHSCLENPMDGGAG